MHWAVLPHHQSASFAEAHRAGNRVAYWRCAGSHHRDRADQLGDRRLTLLLRFVTRICLTDKECTHNSWVVTHNDWPITNPYLVWPLIMTLACALWLSIPSLRRRLRAYPHSLALLSLFLSMALTMLALNIRGATPSCKHFSMRAI